MGTQTFIDVYTQKEFTYDKNFTYEPTYTICTTQFILVVLETGWIDEKSTFLITDGQPPIEAHHIGRGYLPDDTSKIYSFFLAEYVYCTPHKEMQAHWKYSICGTTFETTPIVFEVENLYDDG